MTSQQDPAKTDVKARVWEEGTDDPTAVLEELAGAQGFVDKRLDLAVTCGVVSIGVFLVWGSFQFRQGLVQQEVISATGLPRFLGIFLIVAGGLLLLRRIRDWNHSARLVPSEGGDADEPGYPSTFVRPFLFIVVGVLWIFTLEFLGYVIATPLAGLALLLLAEVREWAKLIGIPLGFVVVTWLLFDRLIGITLPPGEFFGQWLDQVIPRF